MPELFDGEMPHPAGGYSKIPLSKARPNIGAIARRAAATGHQYGLTDNGETIAVVIARSALEDLEDWAAIGKNAEAARRGEKAVSMEELREQLATQAPRKEAGSAA